MWSLFWLVYCSLLDMCMICLCGYLLPRVEADNMASTKFNLPSPEFELGSSTLINFRTPWNIDALDRSANHNATKHPTTKNLILLYNILPCFSNWYNPLKCYLKMKILTTKFFGGSHTTELWWRSNYPSYQKSNFLVFSCKNKNFIFLWLPPFQQKCPDSKFVNFPNNFVLNILNFFFFKLWPS